MDQNESNKEKQRRLQLKRDRGVTFGNDQKDPCKKVNVTSLSLSSKYFK